MSYLLGKRRVSMKLLAVLLAATAVASACGSDGDGDDAAPVATTAAPAEETATTEAPETTEAPTTTATPTTTTEAPEVGPSQGGSASLAIEAEATGLRPWEDTCSSPCYNMMNAVYDKLTEQYADGSYGPMLATSWESNDDFTVWTVQIQEGVTFTDGTPLTAQTIADMFVVQQTGAASAGVIASSNLIAVEATGDHEVTYTLSATNGPFMSVLSRAPMGMVFNPALVPAGDDDAMAAAANAPTGIGTGPFMVSNRDVDNRTDMERNPNYWMSDNFGTQLPYLDSISFHPIPDEGTRLDSLTSGTVTAMQTLRQSTIRDARTVAEDGSLWMFEFQGNNAGGGMFNVLVAPYDDVRVRRGLIMATRQDAIIAALGGEGISEPATQVFAESSPFYSEAVAEAYASYDFDGAMALLEDYINDPDRSDGKAVGEKLDVVLSCPPDPTLIAAMEVTQQFWNETGLVNTELTAFDQATHINMALGMANEFRGEHEVHCWRWGSEADPGGDNSGSAPWETSPFNFSNWHDPEHYALLEEARTTDDVAVRQALYEQANLMVNEQVPIYFSGGTATAIATEAGLGGLDSWVLSDGELGIGHPAAEGRWGQAYWSMD
jgi:peptide/nickel transport system substrate-binding protein